MLDHVLGVKLGSQWTVVYGKGVAEKTADKWGPRVELTCVHQVPDHLLRKTSTYRFSHKADPFDGAIYPLQYGLPRDDREVPLRKSVMLLRSFRFFLSGMSLLAIHFAILCIGKRSKNFNLKIFTHYVLKMCFRLKN